MLHLPVLKMSYFVLKCNDFNVQRSLFLLKKKDVPEEYRKDILHLKCNSIKRVSGISELLLYLGMHTCDAHHAIQPYSLKRISWNEAIDLFGLDYYSDTDDRNSSRGDSPI